MAFRHRIPDFVTMAYWDNAPKPDAEGTFASWLLGQFAQQQISYKAETSASNLYTEMLECLGTVENSEADVSHLEAVLDKIEQASKHIIAAFPEFRVQPAWKTMRADIPKSTWNWWEPERDHRADFAGGPVWIDDGDEHSVAIAKITPEMHNFVECGLPSISKEWGARFREDYFGGFVNPREDSKESKEDNTANGVKSLFLRAHSILRNLWIVRRMAGGLREYFSREGLREDIIPLWRVFGRLLGLTVVKGPGVYSSDLNGIGKCGLVVQFPRVPKYIILVQTEVEYSRPLSMNEFLSTLLAFTSGLNFEDWVWEETQEQGSSSQSLLPTVLPIGLMLSPLGVVRAQYQAHSKRYVCDKHPIWEERADELVFELLSRAAKCGNNDEEMGRNNQLCSSPLPHDTIGHNQRKSARLCDPLLAHVSKQIPPQPRVASEEEEGDEGCDPSEEISEDEEEPSSTKRHKLAENHDFTSLSSPETDAKEGDAEKENAESSLLLKELSEEPRVKQWPLNAYFLSQLGELSQEENFERWRKRSVS